MDNKSRLEPEYITILEGPTPEFRSNVQLWNWGIYQGSSQNDIGWCELRTGNGDDIRERCRRAWREGRAVQLDYPDDMRMRQYVDVVALRLSEAPEGQVLSLWVYLPAEELSYDDIDDLMTEAEDEFDDEDLDDDDDDLGFA